MRKLSHAQLAQILNSQVVGGQSTTQGKRVPSSRTKPKRTTGQEPVHHKPSAESHTPDGATSGGTRADASKYHYTVKITSYRVRLLDEDNLCVKFHVDALRYAGVLPNDNPALTSIRIAQVKVKGRANERTEMEVWCRELK